MKNTGSHTFAWLTATGLAGGRALLGPSESSVIGQVPSFMSRTLLDKPVAVPQGLPADRTLALINFQRGQQAQVESWITGLDLKNDPSIAWMRLPVLNEPGDSRSRDDAQERRLRHYPGESDRANMLPVFTDGAGFVHAAGLNGIDQVCAVVLNRNGEILARVQGSFSPDKAEALRETLHVPGL
jgi:hypothetical protein